MPPNPEQVPNLNGNRYDFASVDIAINSIVYNGFKSLNYKHSLKPGELFGNHAAMIGTTRGQYKVDSCNGEMWTADYQRLVNAIRTAFPTIGYMEARFPMTVMFSEPAGDGVIVDKLLGCRIMSDENGGSEGGDPLVVKVEFHVMRLFKDNQPALISKGFTTAFT